MSIGSWSEGGVGGFGNRWKSEVESKSEAGRCDIRGELGVGSKATPEIQDPMKVGSWIEGRAGGHNIQQKLEVDRWRRRELIADESRQLIDGTARGCDV